MFIPTNKAPEIHGHSSLLLLLQRITEGHESESWILVPAKTNEATDEDAKANGGQLDKLGLGFWTGFAALVVSRCVGVAWSLAPEVKTSVEHAHE